MNRGIFISFEGTEGSGKSTQMRLLVHRLRDAGYAVVENQEPGGTAIGKQIRRILLDPANVEMAPMAELLLMFASRAQAAAQVIVPALRRGDIVISDRFTDSTLAYQGCARGIGFDTVSAAHRLAVDSLTPDLTICIDIDIQTGLDRAHSRNLRKHQHSPTSVDETRIDRQSLDFHRNVAAGYREIALGEPERFRMVNGAGTIADIAERVWQEVSAVLKR